MAAALAARFHVSDRSMLTHRLSGILERNEAPGRSLLSVGGPRFEYCVYGDTCVCSSKK